MMALMRNAKKKEQKKKGKWIGLNNGGERENKWTKKERQIFFLGDKQLWLGYAAKFNWWKRLFLDNRRFCYYYYTSDFIFKNIFINVFCYYYIGDCI